MKKIGLWIGGALFFPIALFLLLSMLLYIPHVQRYLVHKSMETLSETLEMKITVEEVRLSFPLDLAIHNVIAVQNQDTVLNVKKLVVDVPFKPLLHQEIQLQGLKLIGAKVNTLKLIDAVQISGYIGAFTLNSRGVLLDQEKVIINDARLKNSQVQLVLRDSVPEDTTSQPVSWKIDLRKVEVSQTKFQLMMDTMQVEACLGKASVHKVEADLLDSRYSVGGLELQHSSLDVDLCAGERTLGFDYNHLRLDSINLQAHSLRSQGPAFAIHLNQLSAHEACGWKINSLRGGIAMDSTTVHVDDLHLETPYSSFSLRGDIDWSSLDEKRSDGSMNLTGNLFVGRSDLLSAFSPELAEELKTYYPDYPFFAEINLFGNLQDMRLGNTYLAMEKALRAQFSGEIKQVMDDNQRNGKITLDTRFENTEFLLRMLGVTDYQIPVGLKVLGNLSLKGPQYGFAGLIQDGEGKVQMDGRFNQKNESYQADLVVKDLDISHFMPKDSIYLFSGMVKAEGQRMDIFSPAAVFDVQAQLEQLQYKTLDFQGLAANFHLAEHRLTGEVSNDNPYLVMDSRVDGYMRIDSMAALLDMQVHKLDTYQLKLAEDSMTWAFQVHAQAQTDTKQTVLSEMAIDGIHVVTRKRAFNPKNLLAKFTLLPDSINVHAESGDFDLNVHSSLSLDSILTHSDVFTRQLKNQWEQKDFNVKLLSEAFPDLCLKLNSGRDNPVANFFSYYGYGFKHINAHFDVEQLTGLDGSLHIQGLRMDSILLDTVKLSIEQRDTTLVFQGQVQNNKYNPQFIFNAMMRGNLYPHGADSRFLLMDSKNKVAVNMGLQAQFVPEGYRFTVRPDNPFLAYKVYRMKPDDYILLDDDGCILGNLTLLTDEGRGLVFSAKPEGHEKQNMRLQLSKIDLDEMTSILPYAPAISGYMDGTFFLTQMDNEKPSINGKLKFQDLAYEGSPMGKDMDVAMNATPGRDDTYQLTASLRRNGEFITTVGGTYDVASSKMDLETILYHFPADMANGFIPDQMAGLRGMLTGNFKITGNQDNPKINGEITTDSVYLYSEPYAINLRVEDKTIRVKNSRLDLQNLTLYSTKNDKMTTSGWIDFANLEKIQTNLSLRANNFQIVDQKRNKNTLLYGKAYVSANLTVTGLLDELKARGTLSLLGTTDVTYVLKDSPLTVEDRLDDLVTFVDFSDSIFVDREVVRQKVSGVDALVTLDISEGARVRCDLSSNRESYVDLTGGGALNMRYSTDGKILINGRYTINQGEMKYTLPVIPLKTFTIRQGSYVEFSGDMMNPTLSIAATERTRAAVSLEGDSNGRTVEFDVGVELSRTLQDMGLEFTIDAPKDLSVQNELASKSKEERGKLAVAMMATGIYLDSSNQSGGLNMGTALNSFLQSQIAGIAGSALKSVDVSFGVADNKMRDGTVSTDYSFRFAKRLWGNRISIIIGGKVTTGIRKNNDSFIDDISLEYRLDDSGTRYVRLFYEKNFDTILDGQVTKTGAGLVFRKKMNRFDELFIFQSAKKREQRYEERRARREQIEEARKISAEHHEEQQ